MQLELTAQEKATSMIGYTDGMSAQQVLAESLDNPFLGQLAVVSSFGAESVVLLHMVAQLRRDVPVLFIDTRMLFEETLAYQRDVARQLGLTDVRVIRPRHLDLPSGQSKDPLYNSDPDKCCFLRKTQPLERALRGFDGWISGRKRHQSSTRAALAPFEADAGRVKVNPLADWSPQDIASYITRFDLPRHPLVSKGYPSIGCTSCTSKVKAGEDPRSGRWRGQAKEECGIHFVNGRAVRGVSAQQ